MGAGKESAGVSMWNFDQFIGRTPTSHTPAASQNGTQASAPGSVSSQHPRSALAWALLLALAIVLHGSTVPHASASSHSRIGHAQLCVADGCRGDETSSSGAPAAAVPACDQFCLRIQHVYHDARTQELLVLLAQTPTGQGALEYLLAVGAHFGDPFITWRDLRADALVGKSDAGGFIQLDSSLHTERILVSIYLAGILVHEAVESSFDVGEGIRQMGTRHADYVAQWFSGKFERELHALPDYHALDPYYLPTENSAYGYTYDAWLNTTNDGQLYLGEAESVDLRTIDRRGRAWPPSDWLAEAGGFWLLGQGTEVTPIPNPLGLTPAMLVASDLSMMV
jgi:hypothetical protein